jgi:hypothetical protein
MMQMKHLPNIIAGQLRQLQDLEPVFNQPHNTDHPSCDTLIPMVLSTNPQDTVHTNLLEKISRRITVSDVRVL